MFKLPLCAAGFTILLTASTAFAADHGAAIFAQACASCHLESMPVKETAQAKELVAPPMNLLSTIIRKKVGNTEEAFVAHVVDFTNAPAVEKVKAMPEAVRRFGLMPPVKEIAPSISPEDVTAVARWLYARYDYKKELKEMNEHEGADTH